MPKPVAGQHYFQRNSPESGEFYLQFVPAGIQTERNTGFGIPPGDASVERRLVIDNEFIAFDTPRLWGNGHLCFVLKSAFSRFVMVTVDLNHARKLLIALFAFTDIAGINPVFCQHCRTIRIVGQ